MAEWRRRALFEIGGNMKLLLAQLSDIHLAEPEAPPPAEKVAHAIVSVNPAAEACFVAVTGDIAFSGKEEQYAAAVRYLGAVKDALTIELGPSAVHFLAI